jgi:hypothetical protein
LRIKIACVLLASTLLSACPAPYDIWLVPGSTIERLSFRHATKKHGTEWNQLWQVALTTCGGLTQDLRRISDTTYWLAKADMPVSAGGGIVYGQPLVGLRDSIGPTPLPTGCYTLSVLARPGSARLSFRVLATGVARELTKAEQDSASSLSRRYAEASFVADSNALAECRTAYRGVPDDSLEVVDSVMPYDTTRFAHLTCGCLRRLYPGVAPDSLGLRQRGAQPANAADKRGRRGAPPASDAPSGDNGP